MHWVFCGRTSNGFLKWKWRNMDTALRLCQKKNSIVSEYHNIKQINVTQHGILKHLYCIPAWSFQTFRPKKLDSSVNSCFLVLLNKKANFPWSKPSQNWAINHTCAQDTISKLTDSKKVIFITIIVYIFKELGQLVKGLNYCLGLNLLIILLQIKSIHQIPAE